MALWNNYVRPVIFECPPRPGAPPFVHIISLNVGNAARDLGEYSFDKRLDGLIEWMKFFHKPYTIFCFQELRRCKTEDGTVTMELTEILNKISTALNMVYDMGANSLLENSMHKATFYDPKEFIRTDCQVLWPSSTRVPSGPEWAQSMLRSRFICKKGARFDKGHVKEGYMFQIMNCHAPSVAMERHMYCGWILRNQPGTNTLLVGDFNTYDDIDGATQIAQMSSKWIHLSKHITKTFFSFPHDVDENKKRYHGVLDHVFLARNFSIDCNSIMISAEPWPMNEQLSDHYPIHLSFTFNKPSVFM